MSLLNVLTVDSKILMLYFRSYNHKFSRNTMPSMTYHLISQYGWLLTYEEQWLKVIHEVNFSNVIHESQYYFNRATAMTINVHPLSFSGTLYPDSVQNNFFIKRYQIVCFETDIIWCPSLIRFTKCPKTDFACHNSSM
jgi:hypothetical protein